jgi:imidazole glycerol-phosphate synthase subunit HisH
MIGIINYGLGNINAFANIYNKLGIPHEVVCESRCLKKITKIILPGVGSFDYAMSRLKASGMQDNLNDIVLAHDTPVLGVCVGMQMLACSSDEGNLPGLGWIDGKVKKLNSLFPKVSVIIPHMGWNNLKLLKNNDLLKNIECNASFYFLHSYYLDCRESENVVAVTEYNEDFACVVNYKNIYGVQFHPEKSHSWGERLLKNFAEI